MIDAHGALLTYLRAPSDLRTLLGGNYVYWPSVPSDIGMPRKAISFRMSGGSSDENLPVQTPRVTFRCWAESHYEAMRVYRALHDRLHGIQNVIVGDVGIYGAEEDVPGEPLQDRDTTWPFAHCLYTMTFATVALT